MERKATNRNWKYRIGQKGKLADCLLDAGAEVEIVGREAGVHEPGYTVQLGSRRFWVRESELLEVR